jgi:hypothetical protein
VWRQFRQQDHDEVELYRQEARGIRDAGLLSRKGWWDEATCDRRGWDPDHGYALAGERCVIPVLNQRGKRYSLYAFYAVHHTHFLIVSFIQRRFPYMGLSTDLHDQRRHDLHERCDQLHR